MMSTALKNTSVPFFLPFRCVDTPSDHCNMSPNCPPSLDTTVSTSSRNSMSVSPSDTLYDQLYNPSEVFPTQSLTGNDSTQLIDSSTQQDAVIRYVPSSNNYLIESSRFVSNSTHTITSTPLVQFNQSLDILVPVSSTRKNIHPMITRSKSAYHFSALTAVMKPQLIYLIPNQHQSIELF